MRYTFFMEQDEMIDSGLANKIAAEIAFMNFRIAVFDEYLYRLSSGNDNIYRLGQIYFNMLATKEPDIAKAIRETVYDPFYRAKINRAVDDRVLELWKRLPKYKTGEVV